MFLIIELVNEYTSKQVKYLYIIIYSKTFMSRLLVYY